jgi:predicted Zn-dependent peptidase
MKTVIHVLCCLTLLVAAGCSLPAKAVDPRTMTFAPLQFSIPKADRATLNNGIVVYLMEDHELPLVNMTAYVRTGSIFEPADKLGLASLTGSVIRSGGTETLAPEKLDAELEFMASAVESGIGNEMGTMSLTTLTRNLDRTMELFIDVMRHPAFREDRVTLAKNGTIEGLRRQNDDPKGVANREFTRAVYAGHPLGRVPTIETVKKITRDDMIAFHRQFYGPGTIMLAVSGDFRKEELLAALNRLMAGWEGPKNPLPAIAQPAMNKPGVLFARKEVNQSVIRMGLMGIDKNSPDLYALRVMDYILGGGFTSRLTNEIRSNQGLAYNADSRMDVGRLFPGTFMAETETKSESTGKAVSLMRNIMAGMTSEPVTDQEIQQARDSLINSFMFGFTKTDMIVNQHARLEFFGYPAGYLENYRDNLAKVSKDDVLRVARQYLRPEAMVLVVVGDDRKFDQPLSSFGPVTEIKLESTK